MSVPTSPDRCLRSVAVCLFVALIAQLLTLLPLAAGYSKILTVVRDSTFMLGTAAMIICGIRAVRTSGFSIGRALLPGLAYLVCGVAAFACFELGKLNDEIFDVSMAERFIQRSREKIARNEIRDQQAVDRLSRFIAKERYVYSGVKETYRAGEKTLVFQPTLSEDGERRNYLDNRHTGRLLTIYTAAWGANIILGTLLGLLTPLTTGARLRPKRIVYYDRSGPRNQDGFRGASSAAWCHAATAADETFGEFPIAEELYWGLFQLGIVGFFQTLPMHHDLDAYEEGFLLARGLSEAAAFVRKCADGLDRDSYEWTTGSGDEIEYRVIVSREELQGMLAAFAGFLAEGGSRGYDVQMWL